MMAGWEKGTVKSFDIRKGSGCFEVEGKNDIFFYIGDAKLPVASNGQIIWRGIPQRKRIRYPVKGEKVVFCRSSADGNREKASPWYFDNESLQKTLEQAEQYVPVVILYRVIHETQMVGGTAEPSVVWTSKEGEGLSRCPTALWNPKYDGLPFSHDDGWSMRRWVEEKIGDGPWHEYKDPRRPR